WQWSIGTHTLTSGSGSSDPNMGSMFNVHLDTSHRMFAFTYPTEGLYPFFCIIHETASMKGVVKVRKRTDVTPIGSVANRIGFTAPPSPNPSRAGFSFRFALRERGRARAEVFDAAGRVVATVIDRDLDP